MRPLALRTQLTLIHSSILALLLIGLGVAFDQALALQLDADATEDIREVTNGLHGYLRFRDGTPLVDYDADDPPQVAFVQRATRYYQIYDVRTGRLLTQSPGLRPLGLHYTPAEVRDLARARGVHDIETDFGHLRLSDSVITPSAREAYLLQVGVPLEGVRRAMRTFRVVLLWSIPASLAAAAAAGRWMAGRALVPLGRLAASTREVDVADLRRRVPIRGAGDELDEVAGALNEALARLEAAVTDMRQFSTALAHELRAPLAALRAEAELALMHATSADDYRRTLTSQLEELEKLTRLIGQLLTLARAEAGEIPLAHAPVDLPALARSIVDQLEVVAQARGVVLAHEVSATPPLVGDAGWLERLLLNLLDNALKFTGPGGRVTLWVGAEGDTPCVEVRDTGVGMGPEVVAHAFDRFYRGDPARSPAVQGAGLGLTLVKWIADQHGAEIAIESEPGHGTRVRVRLPRAAPATPAAAVL